MLIQQRGLLAWPRTRLHQVDTYNTIVNDGAIRDILNKCWNGIDVYFNVRWRASFKVIASTLVVEPLPAQYPLLCSSGAGQRAGQNQVQNAGRDPAAAAAAAPAQV